MNPNIPVKTHMYITTGLNDNKFGISDEELHLVIEALPNLSFIEFLGIHFHIGSQIIETRVLKAWSVIRMHV